uniref:Uncharacterized protein n=1 Tax=Anguilla anguilla TaxID=7936 RepID=A0A0E9RRY2_ANGAN
MFHYTLKLEYTEIYTVYIWTFPRIITS